jgi:photosystem II stability/assembly factor-like uncharacterized protein
LLHSGDFDAPELDELELRHLYERALGRSAQLRARRLRRRAAGGTVAVACLLVAGLIAASFAATTPGRRATAGSAGRHTAWRLVSEVSAAGSSWQVLSPSGYQQTFSLVCPSNTTCYADSIGGRLEYTHDGGSTWQQAAGTGTATSLPQISCADAQDCDVLAEIADRGSTFLATSDGGQSWTSRPGPALPSSPSQNGLAAGFPGLVAMSCATISSCVVIAYDGASSASSPTEVFTTSDGGASWSQSTLPSPASGQFVPSGLSCSGTTCVAVGSFGLWKSESGPGGRAQGVRTLAGAAYTSDDGGATWTASPAPPDTGSVTSLTCPDATDCYALSSSAVFETEDAGQTWHEVSTSGLPGQTGSPSGWNLISISCATSSSCWLTGAGAPANPPANSPTQHATSSGQAGQALSIGQARGLLASTADGGSTWALSTAPSGVGGVIDVACPDTSTCFALGVEQTGSAPSGSEAVLLTNAS